MKPKRLALALLFLAALLVPLMLLAGYISSRKPVMNYLDSGGPFFEGAYAEEPGPFDGNFKVVAWNLHFAEEVERALSTLGSADELKDADVLLLQEMDRQGVERIAQQLRYNYVYYPAIIHPHHQKEFGNAILSKWPIVDHEKILLPNRSPDWLQSRNAVRARLSFGGTPVQVYNTHLDTTWMFADWEDSQGNFLIQEIGKGDEFAIVGGDFNTWSPTSIAAIEEGFALAGLDRLSKDAGYTFETSGVKLTLDHLFAGGMADFEAGVYRNTKASDHYPLWAEIEMKREPSEN
jgi:endonuclease/exonuclease/phosphatase family metal-dependent hydrolase